MKRWITCLLLLAVLLSLGMAPVLGEEFISEEPVTRDPGFCGEDVTWSFQDGVLTLSGTGATDDFYAGQPWQQYREQIRELRLTGSIAYLGAYAFPDYDSLETVDFGSALTEIGQGAFSGCDGLKTLTLPGTFRVFGEESFSHCKNLGEFHFAGGFPKFKLNCMWDTYAKLFYPAERPWPLEHIRQLEEAFQGRIEFLSSDGTDPYVPQEETQPEPAATETTQPSAAEETTLAAEETAEATGKPETVPETEPVTKPVTVPETMPETEEPTETEKEYVELPEPQEGKPEEKTGLIVAGLIVLAVLSGGGAIFLLGRLFSNSRKEFDGNFSEILLEDERKKPAGKKPTTAQKTAAAGKRKRKGKYSK